MNTNIQINPVVIPLKGEGTLVDFNSGVRTASFGTNNSQLENTASVQVVINSLQIELGGNLLL